MLERRMGLKCISVYVQVIRDLPITMVIMIPHGTGGNLISSSNVVHFLTEIHVNQRPQQAWKAKNCRNFLVHLSCSLDN